MNTSTPFEHRAAASGLTEPLLRQVILSFYEKVRRDAVLGPVFAEAIGDDWDPHIERIMLFWLTATRLGRGYDGRNFMPVHVRNRSIRADQLPRWLPAFPRPPPARSPPPAAPPSPASPPPSKPRRKPHRC